MKNHVCVYAIAELVCSQCQDVDTAEGASEIGAEENVVRYAEARGWKLVDGEVWCQQCIKDHA
jgi:hypothetical protein